MMSELADIDEPFSDDPPPSPVKTVNVPVGENTFNYDKGRKVSGVAIVGMRGKPVKLRRMGLEELQCFMKGARGVPTFYALQFDKRIIHIWPHCVHDMSLQIEYGDLLEDTGEKSD